MKQQSLKLTGYSLDHEVVSDTMLIDYLNPTGTNLEYQGSAPGAFGLTTIGYRSCNEEIHSLNLQVITVLLDSFTLVVVQV